MPDLYLIEPGKSFRDADGRFIPPQAEPFATVSEAGWYCTRCCVTLAEGGDFHHQPGVVWRETCPSCGGHRDQPPPVQWVQSFVWRKSKASFPPDGLLERIAEVINEHPPRVAVDDTGTRYTTEQVLDLESSCAFSFDPLPTS